mmetsp:Transcript_36177/g.95128  ORF Transcript_36177/g.95128 Transcript_36177/m.95128 type:complete len:175 (+) Transcript_36177:421-945(+)
MELLAASDNPQVQRAAAGALCNLCTCEPILEAIASGSETGTRHVRILLVLSQADDPETARYAVSGLANLASFAPAASVMSRNNAVPKVCHAQRVTAPRAGCGSWWACSAAATRPWRTLQPPLYSLCFAPPSPTTHGSGSNAPLPGPKSSLPAEYCRHCCSCATREGGAADASTA